MNAAWIRQYVDKKKWNCVVQQADEIQKGVCPMKTRQLVRLLSVSIVTMVKRDTVLIILDRSVHAGRVAKGFLHHRLRTGTTSKVCIPANRGKMCWPCSKVMVGNRIELRGPVSS